MSLLSWLQSKNNIPINKQTEEPQQSQLLSESTSEVGHLQETVPANSVANSNTTVAVKQICSAYHPPQGCKLPSRNYGNHKRQFQPSWCTEWTWIHYDAAEDKVYCYICCRAERENKLHNYRRKEAAFLSEGFHNWKSAREVIKQHSISEVHRAAVEMIDGSKAQRYIGEILSKSHNAEKNENREILFKIAENIRFLARQGLPLRGEWSKEDGAEINSNFVQLLQLRAKDDARIDQWMLKKRNYTSPTIQNELLQLMGNHIVRGIADLIRGTIFTIMADEITDIANKEQLVIVLRWVSEKLEVHEDLVGLYELDSLTSESIYTSIKDVLLRLNLRIIDARGQCYDGAANMSGKHKGVSVLIQKEEPRCLYTHCYGHSLSLACSDMVKKCPVMRNCLDITYEITKLIKYFPKRQKIFEKVKAESGSSAPGIRVLCPTRWTVRAETFLSIIENYAELQDTWEKTMESTQDTETKTRLIGVEAKMASFDYFFGVNLGVLTFGHTDNLSRALQNKTIRASEGQDLARKTIKTLCSIRNDESFKSFWESTLKKSYKFVTEPELPRKRQRPKRFEVGLAEPHFSNDVATYYRVIFFECLDNLISAISQRFEQPGYVMLQTIESIFLSQEAAEENITTVCNFLGEICAFRLQNELKYFRANSSMDSIHSIIKYFQCLSAAEREMYKECIHLLKILLVNPATNASSERTGSALRRLKTWIRSTIGQKRLNHCMMLHVHQDRTDDMNIDDILNEFISAVSQRRIHIMYK